MSSTCKFLHLRFLHLRITNKNVDALSESIFNHLKYSYVKKSQIYTFASNEKSGYNLQFTKISLPSKLIFDIHRFQIFNWSNQGITE